MVHLKMNCSVIVLSSGKSSRMNFPKALLPFNKKNTFLSHLIKTYSNISNDICVILNKDLFYFVKENYPTYNNLNINYILNSNIEKGKIYSIQLGLRQTKHLFIFIQNIDNPFVNLHLFQSMLNKIKTKHYVVPIYKNTSGHPLLISKEIADELLKINEDNYNIRNILKKFPKIECAMDDEKITWNINTPNDYYYAFNKENFFEELV